MTLSELKNIPLGEYPFLVFSDNVRGIFSFLVRVRTRGYFGHVMWLVGPDELASQWFYFKRFSLDHYSFCNLKLVHNAGWTGSEKALLITNIREALKRPWYQSLYDVPGIIGQLIGIPSLQVPWQDYCSETGDFLKAVDSDYDLKSPDPEELNQWTKARQDRYSVYCRYSPG
jgi:hypothetical protein